MLQSEAAQAEDSSTHRPGDTDSAPAQQRGPPAHGNLHSHLLTREALALEASWDQESRDDKAY